MSLLGGIASRLKSLVGGGYPHAPAPFLTRPGDEELEAAMEEARAALPTFWARFEAKDRQGYMLKVALPTSEERVEHIWMTPMVVADNGSIAGVLLNEPLDIPDLHAASSVIVEPSQVSDWAYWNGNALFGHFTTRVLLPSHTRDEQAQLRAVLSENPVESV